MKNFFESIYGKLILLIFVISIWGMNIMNFSELWNSDNKGVSESKRRVDFNSFSMPSIAKLEYHSVERDPFQWPNSLNESLEIDKINQFINEPEYLKPSLYLTGIMDELAIIKDELGYTYFVSEGDTFNNVFVESIFNDSIKLLHKDKNLVIKLTNDRYEEKH